MIFAYLPCKCLWSNNFLRFPTYTSVCVFVYVYKHACVYKLACVSVYLYLCVNVSVHMSEYLCMCKSVVCQIYLACIPNEAKSAKSENGICMCLCVSVYVCVCGMPNVKLVFFACMSNEPKSAKCEFFKKFITLRILLIDA